MACFYSLRLSGNPIPTMRVRGCISRTIHLLSTPIVLAQCAPALHYIGVDGMKHLGALASWSSLRSTGWCHRQCSVVEGSMYGYGSVMRESVYQLATISEIFSLAGFFLACTVKDTWMDLLLVSR